MKLIQKQDNFTSRRAKQLAISESEYSVRTPFQIASLQP